jgi:hypothetical protein
LTADVDHTIAGLDNGDVRKARRRLRRARDVELLDRCGHDYLLAWKGRRSHAGRLAVAGRLLLGQFALIMLYALT